MIFIGVAKKITWDTEFEVIVGNQKARKAYSVLIGGKGALAGATELLRLATAAGWHAELIIKGTHYGTI
jgi:hypothetical protein